MKNSIHLFYWSNVMLQGWATENYGDLLSRYLVEKISGKKVKWVHPRKFMWFQKKRHYMAIGSILAQATRYSEVWGSGIIAKGQPVAAARFYAVRGPQTRQQLLKMNIDCPEVYGDPALLLPLFFKPNIKKNYQVGWVPHYKDLSLLSGIKFLDDSVLIDLSTQDVERTTMELCACRKILSSSLHGLIVAHAYGIPAVWVKLSNKLFGDDIKFRDYFESVGIVPYEGLKSEDLALSVSAKGIITIFESVSKEQQLPKKETIEKIQKGLLKVCPFKA